MISLFRFTEEMRGSANTVALAWSRAAWMKWSTLSLKVSLRWGRGEGDPAGKKPDRKVAMGMSVWKLMHSMAIIRPLSPEWEWWWT